MLVVIGGYSMVAQLHTKDNIKCITKNKNIDSIHVDTKNNLALQEGG